MRKDSISQRNDTDVSFNWKSAFPLLDALFSGHGRRLASLLNSWQMRIDWGQWTKNGERTMKTKRAESQKRILVLYFEKEYKDGWLIPAPVDYVQVYIYKAGYAAHVVSGVVFVFVFCVLCFRVSNPPSKQFYRCSTSLTNSIMYLQYLMKYGLNDRPNISFIKGHI